MLRPAAQVCLNAWECIVCINESNISIVAGVSKLCPGYGPADTNFNNISEGCSQGRHLVFLVDKNNTSCPISAKSNKLKQVARATLAAETRPLHLWMEPIQPTSSTN